MIFGSEKICILFSSETDLNFLVLNHTMIKCYLLQAFDRVLPISGIDHIHCNASSKGCRS